MSRLGFLVKGELDRLNKYNLFTATSVVLLIWIGLAWLLDVDELMMFIPIILLMDTTMMTIVLVGATMFYEKKEHTVNSILVSPVREDEYLISKVIVNIINSMITLIALSIAVYFMKDVTFNYLLATGAVVVITAVHTVIGIWLTYYAKKFSSMLVNYIIYIFAFLVPTVLAMLEVIGEQAANFLIILPPDASLTLLNAIFNDVEPWRVIFGFAYLLALTVIIYKFVVKPKLNDYAMRETGV
ncbi:MAG: hypothetical protein FH749_09880 [Firmicutes bacterium]|nr:hypothetical protein [Bacillota bacterium]